MTVGQMPERPDLIMKTNYVSNFVAFYLLLVLGLPAEGAGPLTGEKAIQHLKDTGQYESLAAAMTGARYGAKAADGAEIKALAQNPAHGLRSTFTREGLRLRFGAAKPRIKWPGVWTVLAMERRRSPCQRTNSKSAASAWR